MKTDNSEMTNWNNTQHYFVWNTTLLVNNGTELNERKKFGPVLNWKELRGLFCWQWVLKHPGQQYGFSFQVVQNKSRPAPLRQDSNQWYRFPSITVMIKIKNVAMNIKKIAFDAKSNYKFKLKRTCTSIINSQGRWPLVVSTGSISGSHTAIFSL